MRRIVIVAGAAAGAVTVWTLVASYAYARLGQVPFASWWYYAVPWPSDFLWSGLFLVVSAAVATAPFGIGAWLYWQRRQSRPKVYGETKWAGSADMAKGGIVSTRHL